MSEMKVTAVGNWYGSAREQARRIADELKGCTLVVLPACGGGSELADIDAPKLIVNDKHKHIINLMMVMADPLLGPKFYRRLRRMAFHAATLYEAQLYCRDVEVRMNETGSLFVGSSPVKGEWTVDKLEWACQYAICSWMGRGGKGGTPGEFTGALPVRYTPNGGGSGQRFHNWVASFAAWRRILRRCEFSSLDMFDLIPKLSDRKGVGVYVDPPWLGAGDLYSMRFTHNDHTRLETALRRFNDARIVVRYGDHPFIRDLYAGNGWRFIEYASKDQDNKAVPEVLIVRN